MNKAPDADVRRALADYHALRHRVHELCLDEPDADEPSYIREGSERLAKAAALAEQMAWDTLWNAVAARQVRRHARSSSTPPAVVRFFAGRAHRKE